VPHFGLMDAAQMEEGPAALLRAQLHIRGGKRRLRQGQYAAGLAALFDALGFAMLWYVGRPENQSRLGTNHNSKLGDERDLFQILASAHVLQNISAYDQLYAVVESSLDDPLFRFDSQAELAKIEAWMTALGVMPFDENTLPPEDPETP
jgi:hypothetical protein